MPKNQEKISECNICRQGKKPGELVPFAIIRSPVLEVIRKKYPQLNMNGYICSQDLNNFRAEYIKEVLESNKGQLSKLEDKVVKSIKRHDVLAGNVNQEFEKNVTIGQKLSDSVSTFVGSWSFIILFAVILILWIAVNILLIWKPFDPYPFILLNLLLSCLAAVQAPVILMSQNRQTQKDSLRAEHDYSVDLKAELEIRHLHEKVDHLLRHQWQNLLEIQQIQTELMQEIMKKSRK